MNKEERRGLNLIERKVGKQHSTQLIFKTRQMFILPAKTTIDEIGKETIHDVGQWLNPLKTIKIVNQMA